MSQTVLLFTFLDDNKWGTLIFYFLSLCSALENLFSGWMSCVPSGVRLHLQNQLFVYCDSVFIFAFLPGDLEKSPGLYKVSLSRNWCERNVQFIMVLWLLHFILNLSPRLYKLKRAIKAKFSLPICRPSCYLERFTLSEPIIITE